MPTEDETRGFRWICPSCATVMIVQTAELYDDEARGVDATGNFGYSCRCPMCATLMVEEDEIAIWYMRENPNVKEFTLGWKDFAKWRAEQPDSVHDALCEVYDREERPCGCGHDARMAGEG